jgi:hypothetical protein
MYQIGDYVLVAGLGACRIADIAPHCCDNLSYQVLPMNGTPEQSGMLPGAVPPAEDKGALMQTVLFHQILRHLQPHEYAYLLPPEEMAQYLKQWLRDAGNN